MFQNSLKLSEMAQNSLNGSKASSINQQYPKLSKTVQNGLKIIINGPKFYNILKNLFKKVNDSKIVQNGPK